MTEEKNYKISNFRIFLFILILFALLMSPLLWLLPLPIGISVEFNVVYEDSTYFTSEPAVGIDVLVDGVYYGTTDAFGKLYFKANDQDNHTLSIEYNDGLVYEYLIDYNSTIDLVNVVLETKGIDAVFRWDYGSNDLAIGEQVELWYNNTGTFELLGTQTTDSLGMVSFVGLIMGEYKFVGVDHEIPEVIIGLNQSTASISKDLLMIPTTVMFDFDYADSAIFGTDVPVEGLQASLWGWEYDHWETGTGAVYDWHLVDTIYTDADGRIYFYNIEPTAYYDVGDKVWYYGYEYKLTWNYDGNLNEQVFLVGQEADFNNELATKSVSATFKWDDVGTPVASFVTVYLSFTSFPGMEPMVFETDVNGQLTIDGLLMGSYSLEGVAFTEVQGTHLQVIPQILLEPTIGRGSLKRFARSSLINTRDAGITLDFCLLTSPYLFFHTLPASLFFFFYHFELIKIRGNLNWKIIM